MSQALNSNQTAELQQMFATMLRIPANELGPDTSLASLNTSLGGAKVRTGLKRLGLALPAGTTPMTFGALLSAISGEAPAPAAAASTSAPAAAAYATPAPVAGNGLSGLKVGLDVEDVRSLPVAKDYWEHEFYRGSFSRLEISYAVLQNDPRTHFAGFWCAKEALRKCDQTFAGVSPAATAVAHDPQGQPFLTIDQGSGLVRLPHALSISHTAEMATAIVVTAPAAGAPIAAQPAAPAVGAVEAAPLALPSPAAAASEPKKPGGLARIFAQR